MRGLPPVLVPCLSEEPSLGANVVSGFTSSPSGLRDQSRSLSSAPAPVWPTVGALENAGLLGHKWVPGAGCLVWRTWEVQLWSWGARRGAEAGPVGGTANGRGGVKEAKLGRSLRGLPRWQQGPSWQGTGAEPSPREREKGERGREKEGQRVSTVGDAPFYRHFIISFFFLLLETFSPHPSTFLFLCFTSHHRCHFSGEASMPPQPGWQPQGQPSPSFLVLSSGPVVQNQRSIVRLLNICVPGTVEAGTVSVFSLDLGSSPAYGV